MSGSIDSLTISPKGAQILAECSFATAQGIQKVMGDRPYFLNREARNFWLEKHMRSIEGALMRPTSDWDGHDREIVLPRAKDLGKIAGDLALAAHRGGEGTPVEVTKEHVIEASKRVEDDPRCRAAVRSGAGGYCTG